MIVLRSLSGMILLFSTFLLSTPHTAFFTHAQSDFTPTQNWAAGSFFVEGKALYIMGGAYTPNSLTDVTLRQTYSLDLSTSWNTTAPKYTKMTDGIYDYNFPNALMQDGVNWFAVSNQTYYTYNINTGVTTANGPIANLNNITGIRAAMIPTTGDIILPNGYNSSANIASTMRFSPGSQQASSIEPFSGTASLAEYGIVWSDSAKAVFIFGGYTRLTFSTYGTVSSNFVKFDPTSSTWSYITSAGGPSARRAPCMVSANGGTKIIVFGGTGQSDSLPALGDIYFYDVPTSKWSRGVDSSSKAFRAAHACAVTGDYFIAHGGYAIAQTSSPLSEMTSVYNMKTNSWEDQYIAPSSSGGGGGTTTPSSSGSSKGGIIGGVAAAVVVILAGVAFLIYRKKKKGSSDARPQVVEFDSYSKPSDSYGGSGGQGVASAPVIFGQPSHAIQPTSGTIFSAPMSGTVFESQPATSTLYNAHMSGSVHNPQSLPDPNYTSSIQLTPTSQYAHLSTSSPSPTIPTTTSVPGSTPTIFPTSQHPPSPVPVVYNPAAQSVVFQSNQLFQPLPQQVQLPQNPHTILAQDQQHSLQQTELQHQIEYQEAQLQALREQHRAQQQQQQQYSHQPPVVSKPDHASIVYSGLVQTPANPQYIPASGATTGYVWQSAEPTPPRNPQEMRR